MSSYLDVGAACRKRRKGGDQRVFKFKSFSENGCLVVFDGSFRDNVKALLEYGHLENNLCNDGMLSWLFQFEFHRHPPFHILLFVVEEPIEASINLHCKRCQYVGWGHHMICNKKYHFLLPSKDTVAACFNCDEINFNDPNPEEGKFNLVELQSHILHGDFHTNGFGHLLCVNGMEMGSDLAGYQIMDFWDCLCTGLLTRKVRTRHGIEVALRWSIWPAMVWPLGTQFWARMLCISYNDISVIFSRWSSKRVEAATRVIVEALKRAGFRWVSRQEVRDAARTYIGDTGLLDFVQVTWISHSGKLFSSSLLKSRNESTRILPERYFHYQKPTLSTGIFSAIPMAAKIILDTKFLVKEYTEELSMKVKSSLNGKFKLFCAIILRNNEEIDEGLKKPMPPCECVSLKENATFNDLKLEVEKNFREVYWRLRSFVVETIVNLSVKGSDLVLGSVEMDQKIVFLGNNKDQTGTMNEVMVYECGLNSSRIMDCPCGTKEDDGERYLM
ncbi:hypothetical protein CRYUN_Cryun12cG0045900 [Craigia yunnanensis]